MLTCRELAPFGALLAAASRAAPPSVDAGPARLKTAFCAYSFRKALADGGLTYLDLVDMAVEHEIDGIDSTVYCFRGTIWRASSRRTGARSTSPLSNCRASRSAGESR